MLASGSPRRAALLRMLGAEFIVIKPGVPETIRGTPVETVRVNSDTKASSVIEDAPRGSIIIGADTVVVGPDGRIYGKPRSLGEAASMLRRLSGAWHSVYTGVTLIDTSTGTRRFFYEKTLVKLKPLGEEELAHYLASLEPLGKAGGYAVQGLASLLIEEIRGDYYNVVGLPLHRLYLELLDIGYDLLDNAVRGRIARARI